MKNIKNIKCFVLDMDGTIYLGDTLFSFTKGFLDSVIKSGCDFVFLTNNSSKDSKSYIDKLGNMGIHIDEDKMLISNHVIIRYLNKYHLGESVYLAGTDLLKEEFLSNGINLSDRDAQIGVLGFDTTLTYEKLANLCQIASEGKPIYCINPDYNCPVENGGYIPDCGAMAQVIVSATGVTPKYFGKPSKHALDYVLEKTGYKESEIAFVGDRLYTDIAIAQGSEATSILVLTGETKLEDVEKSEIKPDIICASLLELEEML